MDISISQANPLCLKIKGRNKKRKIMKKGKIIFALSCLIIVTICTINLQNSFITAKKAGYYRLIDIVNIAKADGEEPPPADCNGATCDDANGNKYNTLTIGDQITCCGAAWLSRGKKSS